MKHRDVMGSRFAGEVTEDTDSFSPTEGLSNLADCMLVLVCGLMVALVVKYNIDFDAELTRVDDTDSLVPVEETDVSRAVAASSSEESDGSSMYEELGMLYKDPSTGKMYYLSEGDDSMSTSESGK